LDDKTEWEAKADRARRLAKSVVDQETRKVLLELAEEYDARAAETAPIDPTADQPPPT
jgi:hypothetical protein